MILRTTTLVQVVEEALYCHKDDKFHINKIDGSSEKGTKK